MDFTTVKTAKHERLIVWRRRNGLTQVEAAARFGVSPDRYREWEAGRSTDDMPELNVGALKVHEAAYLLRNRAGKTQRELAAEIGCSRLWINQMERGLGNPDLLLVYWGL